MNEHRNPETQYQNHPDGGLAFRGPSNTGAALVDDGHRQPIPPSKYPITIVETDHGFIVEVGCKKIVIEKASVLIAKLAEYLQDRRKAEDAFRDGKFF